MAITKRSEYQIEVVPPYSIIQVKRSDIVEEDSEELGRKFFRYTLSPGLLNDSDALIDTDLSGEPANVTAHANLAWTDAIKEEWRKKLVADKAALASSS